MMFRGCMNSTTWKRREREKNTQGPTWLKKKYSIIFINQLHLFFEEIENKYTKIHSCPSSIRTPSLTSKLKT